MNLNPSPHRPSLLAISSIVIAALVGCSSAAGNSSPLTGTTSPAVDLVTQKYVGLVNGYWNDHVTAEGNAAAVCLGTGVGTQGINPPLCRARTVSMLAVQEKFLSELGATTAPAKFVTQDRIFRAQLPKTVADLKGMISAADAGNKQAILDAGNAFLDDMGLVLGALDQVNPSVQHV